MFKASFLDFDLTLTQVWRRFQFYFANIVHCIEVQQERMVLNNEAQNEIDLSSSSQPPDLLLNIV